jgi:hypothetical protein
MVRRLLVIYPMNALTLHPGGLKDLLSIPLLASINCFRAITDTLTEQSKCLSQAPNSSPVPLSHPNPLQSLLPMRFLHEDTVSRKSYQMFIPSMTPLHISQPRQLSSLPSFLPVAIDSSKSTSIRILEQVRSR